MTFEAANLHPVGRNPQTGNIVWYYVSTVDAIAALTAVDYFTALNTGLALQDVILAVGTDGIATLAVQAIDAGDSGVTTSGGTVTPLDVIIDGPILPDIGGTATPTNLQGALERIHNRLNLKVQNGINLGTGVPVFVGVDTSDPSSRIMRFRQLVAGSGITLDIQNDAIVINADGGGTPGGGGGGTNGSKIPAPPGDLGFTNGGRLVYVTANLGENPIGNETATVKFTTIQAALNAAQANDVILVRSGVTRGSFPLTLSNFGGPLWIVAEERGQARISSLWPEPDQSAQNFWTNDGDGVFFASHPRPYIGSHNNDFLMYFKTEGDLRATSVDGVTKPRYGLAFVPSENRVYVRLRNDVNPNGQQIKITDSFTRTIFDFNNCDNVIVDGFVIEGSGNTPAIEYDENCTGVLVRNCVFTHGRHGVRLPDNSVVDTCEYRHTGFGDWAAEVLALDGKSNNGVFTLAKNYYNATVIGGGSGDALLEGSIDIGPVNAQTGLVFDKCLLGPAFDGCRIGNYNNSELRNSVMLQCRDDGFQNESFRSTHQSSGNQIHDCRFVDCFVGGSHQGGSISGVAQVYRNVFENRDARFFHNILYILKTLSTPGAASMNYYHNTFINFSDPGASNQFVWYDFSNGTANRIINFLNNIVIYPGSLTNGSGPNPQVRASNALVAPSSNGTIQGSGGVFAGTSEGDMGLGSDLALLAGSPAVGIGTTLPGGLPDSRSGAGVNDDAGAFPLGEAVGANWPRERTTTFDLNPPSLFS